MNRWKPIAASEQAKFVWHVSS